MCGIVEMGYAWLVPRRCHDVLCEIVGTDREERRFVVKLRRNGNSRNFHHYAK